MLERIAHAKINLALHVIGQREDGYHLIDSLVVFTQIGDVILIEENPTASSLVNVTIDGPFSTSLEMGANNLVSRAALALAYQVTQNQGKPKPVQIKLTKNLPISSGIGGGSADAAATLLALQEFWGSTINLEAIALELGADVPMCLQSKPLRARGVGEKITALQSKQPMHVVLVNPGVEVSTPEIFKRLVDKNNAPINTHSMNAMPDIQTIKHMRNDLQTSALELEPVINETLNALKATSAELTRMSGSGATCFGIYLSEEEANEAVATIYSRHPNWWCVATSTTVS